MTKQRRPGQPEHKDAATVRGQRRSSRAHSNTETAVAQVITAMRRDGVSLAHALRGSGVTRNTVLRHATSALQKQANGRYTARRADRLIRVVHVLTNQGERDITVRGSKDATLIAEHWNAVHTFLAKGDKLALQPFTHTRVTDASGAEFRLMTDTATLKLLGGAGVLSFESIYARAR